MTASPTIVSTAADLHGAIAIVDADNCTRALGEEA
jgi:hypothetical protein